jgi:hypothetical protein
VPGTDALLCRENIIDQIIEAVGPVALKVMAAMACAVVFAPLLAALIAPVLG